MAMRQLPPLLSTLFPVAHAPVRPAAALPLLRRLQEPFLRSIRIPLPFASIAAIPSLLDDIWGSILRAVPKKKTSYMKKRHRFMAGKGIKDVTALNKCSACGRVKRAHVLCPYCVQSLKMWFKGFIPGKGQKPEYKDKFEGKGKR
ncbi:hypothetical protein K432DRAFT_379357 [Lepidopterella palustris CBS 459.81]|uniref:Large ribosomal subunit protein bL32m n=1 Tax=Lepidopterella palustris CBS 459.81 TaxID=1314670 RepID=A0A8E2EH18_9PEZI|nr:hypothetical protein K432DRAFT_379357 [Lepidopterella palustris CBS 459.81]